MIRNSHRKSTNQSESGFKQLKQDHGDIWRSPSRKVIHHETKAVLSRLPCFSWAIFKSCTLFEWASLGDKGARDNKGNFRMMNEQLGIVNALLLGVVAGAVFSGNFVVFEDHGVDSESGFSARLIWVAKHAYLFVWCAAFLNFLYGTLIAMILNIAEEETNSESQFNNFQDLLGVRLCRAPYYFLHVGTLLIWIGLIAYVVLTFNFRFMICCLFACSFYLWFFIWMITRITHSIHVVHEVQESLDAKRSDVGPDEIYDTLQHYWEEEIERNFGRLNRTNFLEHFSSTELEATRILAEAIYDDWFDKKIKSLLREDPGF